MLKRVVFSPKQLKSLSGADKLALLRDLYSARQAHDTSLVFTTIAKNGLSNLLGYHDYHCILHLLRYNPTIHHDAIQELQYYFNLNGLRPTSNYLNDLILIAVKWKDENIVSDLLLQLKKLQFLLRDDSLAALLKFYNSFKTVDKAKIAWTLWIEAVKSGTTPSLTSIVSVFETLLLATLFPEADKLFSDTMNNIILYTAGSDENGIFSARVRILNAYLSVLIKGKMFSKAQQVMAEFENNHLKHGLKSKYLSSTLILMLRLAYSCDNPTLACQYFDMFKTFNLKQEVLVYIMMMKVFGHVKDFPSLDEWFQLARSQFESSPSKIFDLRQEYLVQLVALSKLDLAYDQFELLLIDSRKILKVVYFSLLDAKFPTDEKHKIWSEFEKAYKEDWEDIPAKYKRY
jgi:hypothetical protein